MRGFWEILPLALIVASALYGLANLGSLPERVAIHFNAHGQPDNWMGRGAAIWLAPGFALLFYAGFSLAQTWVPALPNLFVWKTLMVFLMANVQVATVLYSAGKLRAPLLSISPALILLIVYGIWVLTRTILLQGKG